jgi:hypothetical protein
MRARNGCARGPHDTPLALAYRACPLRGGAANVRGLRADLIVEARSWIGTPYRQSGATKGVGVDYAMLLVRCAIDAGPIEPCPFFLRLDVGTHILG